jgi:hypothetical protein
LRKGGGLFVAGTARAKATVRLCLRASGEVPEQEVGATADGAGAELGVGRAWLDVEFRGRSGRVQRSVERP